MVVSTSSHTSAALQTLKDVSIALQNFPYLKSLAGVAVQILDIREEIAHCKDLSWDLIGSVEKRTPVLITALQQVGPGTYGGLERLEMDLREYDLLLKGIYNELQKVTNKNSFAYMVHRGEIRSNLEGFMRKLADFDGRFSTARLTELTIKFRDIAANHSAPSRVKTPTTHDVASHRGIRDGAFVKFRACDIPGHDVGNYFGHLRGQAKIDALKSSALQYGSPFFAFNSNGWCKTWTNLVPSSWAKCGATLYILVQYPGWVFHSGKDSPGHDIGNANANAVPEILREINNRSNPHEVVAFNTNGWMKRKAVFPFRTFPAGSTLIEGCYVREHLFE